MVKEYCQIAFLGIGIMGSQMARHLCRADFSVTVWNRTPEKAESLQDHGARVARSPGEAVAEADVIIAMLADYQAARSVYFTENVLDEIPAGSFLVDMATYAPEESLELAEAAARRGIRFIDAPVSGGEKGAADGTLSIMAGGDPVDIAAVSAVLKPLGRLTHVGPAGSGTVAKLCNQIIVGNTVLAVAEALNLAQAMGADPQAVHSALLGGFADSVILKEHGQRMVEGNFLPGGPAKYMQKILVTAAQISASKEIPLPLAGQSRTLFDAMINSGRGDLDLSGVIEELRTSYNDPEGE